MEQAPYLHGYINHDPHINRKQSNKHASGAASRVELQSQECLRWTGRPLLLPCLLGVLPCLPLVCFCCRVELQSQENLRQTGRPLLLPCLLGVLPCPPLVCFCCRAW